MPPPFLKNAQMDKLKEFNINFSGLSEGFHHWTHQINADFLAEFEAALVENATVEVKVQLEKRTHLLIFDFEMEGTIDTDCDTCGQPFSLAIQNQDRLMVKMVSETVESEEPDVIYLEFGNSHVHIAQYLYEMLMLAIPMRKIHPLDDNEQPTCDPNILKLLSNNSATSQEEPEEDQSHSVWDALKGLKNKK